MTSDTPVSAEEFESAALPHLNELYRTARHVIGEAAQAEDLVQETYLQAWKSFNRFEVGTNCRAWLFKILFHVIQQHRRRRFAFNLRSTRDESIELESSLVFEAPVPQELTDEDVIAALGRLPQQYREALLLADVQGFSYKEIADTLNIPLGTVMSRLNRGRRLLRRELADYAQAYGVKSLGLATEAARA